MCRAKPFQSETECDTLPEGGSPRWRWQGVLIGCAPQAEGLRLRGAPFEPPGFPQRRHAAHITSLLLLAVDGFFPRSCRPRAERAPPERRGPSIRDRVALCRPFSRATLTSRRRRDVTRCSPGARCAVKCKNVGQLFRNLYRGSARRVPETGPTSDTGRPTFDRNGSPKERIWTNTSAAGTT